MFNAIALAFVATVVIEVLVAWLFGWRPRDLLAVLLVNVITNIPLNTIIWGSVDFKNFNNFKYPATLLQVSHSMTMLAEVLVVLIEWWLLTWATKKPRRWTFLVSVVMNAASFAAGWFLVKYF